MLQTSGLLCPVPIPLHQVWMLSVAPATVLVDSLPDRSRLVSQFAAYETHTLCLHSCGQVCKFCASVTALAKVCLWSPLFCSASTPSPLLPHIPSRRIPSTPNEHQHCCSLPIMEPCSTASEAAPVHLQAGHVWHVSADCTCMRMDRRQWWSRPHVCCFQGPSLLLQCVCFTCCPW